METTKPSQPWAADHSRFSMIDVAGKAVTCRRAIARGEARLAPSAFRALVTRTNPKGDVLALAEVAGITSAKRTSDFIPLCHPLPINSIALRFFTDESRCAVRVECEVTTEAKTGVEMEALSGVNGALLTIYDLSKAVDPVITLSEIRLELKEGGKHGDWRHPDSTPEVERPERKTELKVKLELAGVSACAITVSDRSFQGVREDRSGPVITDFLQGAGAKVVKTLIVPDERKQIQQAVLDAIREHGVELVVVSGGTGISPRDVTPDAIQEICERAIPGVGELLRSEGARSTPMSWLSRSGAWTRGKSLILALPGSPKAVKEGLETLSPILSHALQIARGGDHG